MPTHTHTGTLMHISTLQALEAHCKFAALHLNFSPNKQTLKWRLEPVKNVKNAIKYVESAEWRV